MANGGATGGKETAKVNALDNKIKAVEKFVEVRAARRQDLGW